jgi:two-component system, LytTR family, response regulator
VKINCIIIEDEPLASEQLAYFISKVPFLILIKSFASGIDALGYLKSEKTDLIFLDIQMDELTGIQLLESLVIHPKVILTTAFEEYAIKGFDMKVSDYLLKPYTFDRFLQSVNKVYDELNLEINRSDSFFVKTEHRLERISFDKILYIEGMRDYRRIFLSDKSIMTLQNFTELEQILPNSFCRVHNSFIVSIDKIESIERDRIKVGNKLIPISDKYKNNFYKKITN